MGRRPLFIQEEVEQILGAGYDEILLSVDVAGVMIFNLQSYAAGTSYGSHIDPMSGLSEDLL